jgi:Transglutaminase-like superfamily
LTRQRTHSKSHFELEYDSKGRFFSAFARRSEQVEYAQTTTMSVASVRSTMLKVRSEFCARGDRTASDGYEERRGVCRDFAHLAMPLSRCMNTPARYCTGYLGDIGVPADPAPMDFSA